MAQLVANINGKNVYSNKPFRAIKGGRVEFEDGSWCDVSTGQVVNRGSGYITIGAPPDGAGSKPVTKGPLTFRSRILEVSGVHAKVTIEPYEGEGVEVTVTGEKEEVEGISMTELGECLVISGQSSRGTKYAVSGTTVISGRAIDSIIKNVVFMAGQGAESTRLDIKVPLGAPVRLNRIRGEAEVGDTLGPLIVNLDGSNQIRAGRVTDADLLVTGSGNIRITETNGYASIDLAGSAKVRVYGGAVSKIKAHVSGSGEVYFGGKAQEADISIAGSGDVNLAHVQNRPQRCVTGSGHIYIGNW